MIADERGLPPVNMSVTDQPSNRRYVNKIAALATMFSLAILAFALLRPGRETSALIMEADCGNGIKPNIVQRVQTEVSFAKKLLAYSAADVHNYRSHMLARLPEEAWQRQLMERLYKHRLGLPDDIMRRAVSYGGDPQRLHRVLHKLIRGEPVSVAAVGGSVTAGQGAKTENLTFRERVFSWIQATFPHEDHQFVNGGLSAAPSSYMSQCIHDYAPLEADLVFVEFSINDRQDSCKITTDGRRGFEELLRKLLRFPRAPAVIVLHWWSPLFQEFWKNSEDHLDVFSKYYGLPSISWRDALHHLIATNATGFTTQDLYFGKTHPNGYNGHRYFADMIISFLRNEAATLVVSGIGPLSPAVNVSAVAPLPKPMLPGNDVSNTTCLHGQQLRNVIVSAKGFDWVNEGDETRPKWGYVSWKPGNKLRLKVNTATYHDQMKILIATGILKSYEHMGQAELTCESGCTCDPTLLEGHWDHKTSQKHWIYAAASQSRKCLMAITTLNSTSTGEHKVLINSILVTDLHADTARWFKSVDYFKHEYDNQLALEQADIKASIRPVVVTNDTDASKTDTQQKAL